MRLAITGSTGFIGTALAAAAEAQGHEVVAFVRPRTTPTTGETIRWDPSAGTFDRDDVQRVGHVDSIIHLAGAGIADRRWTPERRREILTSRVASTTLVAQVAVAFDRAPQRVVSGSAIGWYGSRGDEELDESSASGEGYLAQICREWEDATAALRDAGIVTSLARTGIVIDPAGGALRQQLPLFRFGLGGKLGSGRQWISPISLHDEVRALLYLAEHDLDGAVNLTGPAPLRNRDFTQQLAKHLHRPALAAVPRLALHGVLGAELADEAILASQRVLPRRLVAEGFQFDHPTFADILSAVLPR